jgi:hypothetical protein
MVAAQQTNSNLPTLPGGFNYPPPTVPPTAGAPYLRPSPLPQDFIFIIVGAAIAFVAFLILAWRIGSAWSINHSFKKHADMHYTPLPEMKKAVAAPSSHHLNDLKLPRNFSQSANSSLFFSPTAEAAKFNQRPTSQYLPAGHYRNNSDPITQRSQQ